MGELTDVAKVRQFMQKSTSDTLQDADLETLIPQASEAIQRYCNREFTPTAAAIRSFEYTPNGFYDVLDLSPYELRALTNVHVDPEVEGGIALTGTQYRLRPFPPRDGTYFGLRLSALPLPKPPTVLNVGEPFAFFTRRVDILGDWGMLTVPKEIVFHANLTVETWIHLRRSGGMPGQEALGEGSSHAEDLPMATKAALSRRWTRPESLI